MKILFLNPSGQLGGGELSLLDLMASLRAERPEWNLALIASAEGPLIARANEIGVQTFVVPFPPDLAQLGDSAISGNSRLAVGARLAFSAPSVLRYRRDLARAIRSFAPDVLHTNGFKMHVLGAMSVNGTPLVWHVRDFVGNRPIMARLMRHAAKSNIFALANSNAVADDLRNVLKGKIKVKAIYDAIDIMQFSPSGPTLDLDALSVLPTSSPQVVRVGLVATFAFWKGHEVFLRAIALLPEKLNVRGYVIGGEIYQTSGSQISLAKLRALASELGISDRVGFTGQVADSAAAMRSLDIVVHASTRPEPFGRVIVEAMACGRAVITSASGGSAELVTSEVDALTHTAGDAQSLADAISRLAASADLRQKLTASGLDHARTHFDLKRLASELAPIYEGRAS